MTAIKIGRTAIDLSGRTFNKLSVLIPIGVHHKGSIIWKCRCECGGFTKVTSYRLKTGHTKSCGCLKGGVIRHGKTGTPEYYVWTSLRQRCNDSNTSSYQHYGGRGISVCERWNDFANFLEDMGERPTPDHQIDRIENDGDYTPDNCRWATRRQQAGNKRVTRNITFNGETMCIRAWARKLDINYLTLYRRIVQAKWPIERALTEHIGKYHNK